MLGLNRAGCPPWQDVSDHSPRVTLESMIPTTLKFTTQIIFWRFWFSFEDIPTSRDTSSLPHTMLNIRDSRPFEEWHSWLSIRESQATSRLNARLRSQLSECDSPASLKLAFKVYLALLGMVESQMDQLATIRCPGYSFPTYSFIIILLA